MQVFLLPAVLLCLATQGAARPGLTKTEDQSPHIKLGHFKIKLFPFPHLSPSDGDTRRRVGGFFVDNPLMSVKRSFQVKYVLFLQALSVNNVGIIFNWCDSVLTRFKSELLLAPASWLLACWLLCLSLLPTFSGGQD